MTAVTAPDDRARQWIAALAGVALACLFFADSCAPGVLPACAFHSLTGLYCPGCGSSRAFFELLHGHFGAALRLNAFTVLTVPPIAAFLLLPQRITARLRPAWHWAALYALAAVIFAVLRNLPQFHVLAP